MSNGGPSAPSLTDLRDVTPESLPAVIRVPPLSKPFDVVVRPPGSKSITNRVLLLAALASGESLIHGALVDADDARVMIEALRRLGAEIGVEPGEGSGGGGGASAPVVRVRGVGGGGGAWRLRPGETITLNLDNAGTATRFLAAAALLAPPGTAIVVDGNERMRQRPMGELTALLRRLGATAEHTGAVGCPPLRIAPPADLAALPSEIEIGPTQSSQFISALALVAGFLPRGLTLRMTGAITSEPYVAMTAGVLERLGVAVGAGAGERGVREISVRPLADGTLARFTYNIEPDLSGATYFWAAAALMPGARLRIDGYPDPYHGGSLQGDAGFLDFVLDSWDEDTFGCEVSSEWVVTGPARLRPVDADLSDMPDTAMTAAVLACFALPTASNPTATSTLRGLRTLRVKETDRLAALQTELGKLGAEVEIIASGGARSDEALRITPPAGLLDPLVCVKSEPPSVVFDTYGDHRMAMALSLVGLRRANTFIRNPACVAKTYPTFWRDLRSLYGGS